MDKKLIKEIALRHRDSITPPFNGILFDQVGFDGLYALSEEYGGGQLYVPTLKSLFMRCVKKQIQTEFCGNYRELSQKYGVSERTIRCVIQEMRTGR